jgi:hypothetical protein
LARLLAPHPEVSKAPLAAAEALLLQYPGFPTAIEGILVCSIHKTNNKLFPVPRTIHFFLCFQQTTTVWSVPVLSSKYLTDLTMDITPYEDIRY